MKLPTANELMHKFLFAKKEQQLRVLSEVDRMREQCDEEGYGSIIGYLNLQYFEQWEARAA